MHHAKLEQEKEEESIAVPTSEFSRKFALLKSRIRAVLNSEEVKKFIKEGNVNTEVALGWFNTELAKEQNGKDSFARLHDLLSKAIVRAEQDKPKEKSTGFFWSSKKEPLINPFVDKIINIAHDNEFSMGQMLLAYENDVRTAQSIQMALEGYREQQLRSDMVIEQTSLKLKKKIDRKKQFKEKVEILDQEKQMLAKENEELNQTIVALNETIQNLTLNNQSIHDHSFSHSGGRLFEKASITSHIDRETKIELSRDIKKIKSCVSSASFYAIDELIKFHQNLDTTGEKDHFPHELKASDLSSNHTAIGPAITETIYILLKHNSQNQDSGKSTQAILNEIKQKSSAHERFIALIDAINTGISLKKLSDTAKQPLSLSDRYKTIYQVYNTGHYFPLTKENVNYRDEFAKLYKDEKNKTQITIGKSIN